MLRLTFLALALAMLATPLTASAQDGTALAAALTQRFPENEIVPQSCAGLESPSQSAGRLCLRDATTGLVRVVRRLGLVDGDYGLEVAQRGTDIVFAVGDWEGARTRYAGRAWRWDLTRDAYLGLASLEEYADTAIMNASFGILFETAVGFDLFDGERARRVAVPEVLTYGARTTVVDGVTYVTVALDAQHVDVSSATLEGDRVVLHAHASLPGVLVHERAGLVVTAVAGRRGRLTLHALQLPSTTPITIEYPERFRTPRTVERAADGTLVMTGPRRQTVRVDLAARTATAIDPVAPTEPAPTLGASSLIDVHPTSRGGLHVQSSSRTFVLDASGAGPGSASASRRARTPCRCDGTGLVCGDTTIAGACTEVAELEVIRSDYEAAPQRTIQYTDRFRVDRLEPDYVRVTRLRDGARLWVRMFGAVLFAQADDGAFFVTDRSILDRLAIRRGRALLTAPIAPLAPDAGSLFRDTLIADFFGP